MAGIDLRDLVLCCNRLRSPHTFRYNYSAPLLPNPKRQQWPRLTRPRERAYAFRTFFAGIIRPNFRANDTIYHRRRQAEIVDSPNGFSRQSANDLRLRCGERLAQPALFVLAAPCGVRFLAGCCRNGIVAIESLFRVNLPRRLFGRRVSPFLNVDIDIANTDKAPDVGAAVVRSACCQKRAAINGAATVRFSRPMTINAIRHSFIARRQ
jgi:hypothetical protein